MYTTSYTFGTETSMPFGVARQRIEELLKEVGFGVLTVIDIKETMKKKLGVEFRPYLILGTCNPMIAHEALKREIEIGSLLPCNVIVYENDNGGTNVSIMDPLAALGLTGNKELTQQAQQVRELLQQVLAKL